MTTTTVFLLIVAAFVAFALSFYQYLFKAKKKGRLQFFLAFLRFVTYFSIFLLLINPIITRKDYETVKTPLPILVDNSLSVKELGQDTLATQLYTQLLDNKQLKEKYDVQLFSFADGFESGKTPDFTGKQTHIDQAVQNLKQLYRNSNYPVVLLTDGNQTLGNDYVYSFSQNTAVYPLVLGDTTLYTDLKINQVNVNKYALLKNKFPAEVFVQYNGTKPIDAVFSITQGNSVLHKQNISFTNQNKAQAVTVLLNAERVGVQTYKATITSAEQEKNRYNNTKNFAVEVIDQRSEVAIVSSITHPDLGALKRAIETNKQRNVTIVKPNEVKSLQDYNVLLLYQPDATFKSLLEQNKSVGVNTFIITGLTTDFNLLNRYQDELNFKMTSQRENYAAGYNPLFNLFSLDDIGFEQFPPLEHPFGTVTSKSNAATLLRARIRNIETENPLMVFSEKGASRTAFLLGENIWKWRVESHLTTKSFDEFDVFIDKTIQFLASNSKRKSLVVNHESFYNSGEVITVTAQFFNKNYEFDENARINIQLKNNTTNQTKNYDFLKGNNEYKVNLEGLEAGKYSFTVKESNTNTTYNSSFEVLDFEIEKQFVNPDLTRLKQVAAGTNGMVYYPDQADKLINFLVNNENYKPLQKAITQKSPLIDWIWLLIILAITLAVEWFVRKYNGLL
ncbi:hypothetical protein E0W68_12020 [Flavobacterium salilacus subsp. salilacus]|uniref:hypothetical protein n=1 Tax=Flavobacterium TaxID=237 RepID=UPI001075773C|nr:MULTISPECIES: hypothetical protein [Flavobacterium]KAF2516253.1 hypothetical protein E0W68_12020 [Flavobacterium salilacus subsp. salilacus]MBE1613781.1 hypothetical protein [Flavobacterium sp. SaA2.13]